MLCARLAEPADSRILRAKNPVGSGPAVELSVCLGLAKIGMLYRFLIDKTLSTCLYKHTARLPQAGPEAAAFQEGENSMSDAPMVNKSAETDLRATKMLFDMLKEVQQKAGAAALEPAKLTAPDRAVVEQFAGRLRRQIADEAAETAADRAADPSR